MTKQEQWSTFLEGLLSNAAVQYEKTIEYEYIQKQYDEIDMILRDNLKKDEKAIVEECLYDISLMQNKEVHNFYKQGIKDCIFILKQLKVLA